MKVLDFSPTFTVRTRPSPGDPNAQISAVNMRPFRAAGWRSGQRGGRRRLQTELESWYQGVKHDEPLEQLSPVGVGDTSACRRTMSISGRTGRSARSDSRAAPSAERPPHLQRRCRANKEVLAVLHLPKVGMPYAPRRWRIPLRRHLTPAITSLREGRLGSESGSGLSCDPAQ